MSEVDLLDPDAGWRDLPFVQQREVLASALARELPSDARVVEVWIEAGPPGREYDLTAAVRTDVGVLRTPFWSHARAAIFRDPSVHPANRGQLAPAHALRDAAERLRRRLAVPYTLESRGLTATLVPEEGVERVWTAEHARFRDRTAVTREDRVARAADVDVRDLLAHFYSGPSLRLVGPDGGAFLLPAAEEAEGPLATLCHACRHWSEGAHALCPECGAAADVVIAVRPPRR